MQVDVDELKRQAEFMVVPSWPLDAAIAEIKGLRKRWKELHKWACDELLMDVAAEMERLESEA